MYAPHSPALSSSNSHSHADSTLASRAPKISLRDFSSHFATPTINYSSSHAEQPTSQCLRFKYFTTFLISATCLALLSASLATHKWIVSRPMRVLRLGPGREQANLSALMLAALQGDDASEGAYQSSAQQAKQAKLVAPGQLSSSQRQADFSSDLSPQQLLEVGNKFQGEIYFGLFNGVKVLNHGFGDRVSQISGATQAPMINHHLCLTRSHISRNSAREVLQAYYGNSEKRHTPSRAQELVRFKSWLITLSGVVAAICFGLTGCIFAIINFVMTPTGTITGPVGLVVWNALACFACSLAVLTWLIEFHFRIKTNVLTNEEQINGWTSDDRSQFGYSYYLVVAACVLYLINIFIVSLVRFESWTSQKMKRHSLAHQSSACEGVIMLY